MLLDPCKSLVNVKLRKLKRDGVPRGNAPRRDAPVFRAVLGKTEYVLVEFCPGRCVIEIRRTPKFSAAPRNAANFPE